MKFYRQRKDLVQEKLGKHYNPKRQGHGARVDKATMYRMRWLNEFDGWPTERLAAAFGLEYRYVMTKVVGYETMASVVPLKSVKPDDYAP